MEHPFYGSWGYQTTGYFAPTSRYGTPQDFMFLVDQLHQAGFGVILDWVPSHFPDDAHGLAVFDGTHLYEHADPRQGFHPDWHSQIFNYNRHEVQSFLISSALFWLDVYHADGLRVDAVASMLYLDYSRKEGEWIPNEYGGRENLAAIDLLRRLNTEVYRRFPDVQTFAEESTSWPLVSRPADVGGLGFGLKWDMGWMHDTLVYMQFDPVHRRYHHDQLTFRSIYAYAENFVLPLSHDEVVHGKGSLLGKMPGDRWQQTANLRLLYGYMYGLPGKKLLFMGDEFGQVAEWDHTHSLEWHLLDVPAHAGIQRWVGDLNALLRAEPALHEVDHDPVGMQWVVGDDRRPERRVLPAPRPLGRPLGPGGLQLHPGAAVGYRVGVPYGGRWAESLNSDAVRYGGSGIGNLGGVEALAEPAHGHPYSIRADTAPPGGRPPAGRPVGPMCTRPSADRGAQPSLHQGFFGFPGSNSAYENHVAEPRRSTMAPEAVVHSTMPVLPRYCSSHSGGEVTVACRFLMMVTLSPTCQAFCRGNRRRRRRRAVELRQAPALPRGSSR